MSVSVGYKHVAVGAGIATIFAAVAGGLLYRQYKAYCAQYGAMETWPDTVRRQYNWMVVGALVLTVVFYLFGHFYFRVSASWGRTHNMYSKMTRNERLDAALAEILDE